MLQSFLIDTLNVVEWEVDERCVDKIIMIIMIIKILYVIIRKPKMDGGNFILVWFLRPLVISVKLNLGREVLLDAVQSTTMEFVFDSK